MKPEEQRIAIAEACNWPQPNHADGTIWMPNPNGSDTSYGLMSEVDPLRSLDAMHEASANALTPSQTRTYRDYLIAIIRRDDSATHQEAEWMCIDASAPQRAEAFLRTLGKWEPQPEGEL